MQAFCERWIVGWREWRDFVVDQRGYDLRLEPQTPRISSLAQIEMLAQDHSRS